MAGCDDATVRRLLTVHLCDVTGSVSVNQIRESVGAWLRQWWRALVAEVVATALLVWLGVSALMPVRGAGSVVLTHPALAFGFVVTANLMAFGPVSGAHMNPAVTLGALIYGKIPIVPAIAYVVAQNIGAILGFGVLIASTAASVLAPAGCTAPAATVGVWSAVLMEAALTGVLVLACCGLWAAHDDKNPDHSAPIKLGLVVAGVVYAGGHATGASLNPARSIAPALLHGEWTYLWIYIVGPLSGAAAAALLHRFVLTTPAKAPATPRGSLAPTDDPAALPLQDKV